MTQNRKPPAFQEYAASFIANKNFRLMTLEERGLLMTMRFECWENLSVPLNRVDLAKYLGLDEASIPLTERVLSFFIVYEATLICPELENYRQYIKERREKQSNGGKKGAEMTNKTRATRRDGCESLDKDNSVNINQKQSLESGSMENAEKDKEDDLLDDWLSDYESRDSEPPF